MENEAAEQLHDIDPAGFQTWVAIIVAAAIIAFGIAFYQMG